jgi:5-methylcytosine-specific restriction endonuclease McrA
MAYLSNALKARLRAHFSYACAYCHSPEFLSNAIFEFDHIVPEASGGDTTFENLCFCCPKCNSYNRLLSFGKLEDSNVRFYRLKPVLAIHL